MATRRIGITLSGDMIPLSLFLEASRGLNVLLSEIDVAISGSRNLEWTIENLSIGSANLSVTPSLLHEDSIDQSALVISSALLGMEKIEKGGQWPEHFTETALLKAKEIVSIIDGKVERVAFSVMLEKEVCVCESLSGLLQTSINLLARVQLPEEPSKEL